MDDYFLYKKSRSEQNEFRHKLCRDEINAHNMLEEHHEKHIGCQHEQKDRKITECGSQSALAGEFIENNSSI